MSAIYSRASIAFALLLSLSATSFAQSGSAGGSLGNDDKAISGTRSAPRASESEPTARPSRPAAESRSRKSAGGGGFDGAWVVVGVGLTCSGTSSNAVVVSSGKIIGQGVSGTVSSGGAVSAVGSANGLRIVSSGHLSGRSGSGTFRQSDGCTGRWSASKQ